VVLPGAIDAHLHLGHGKDISRPRVPEDAAQETAAAAVGGITCFVPYLMATEPFETIFDGIRTVTEAGRPHRFRLSLHHLDGRPSSPACRATCATMARRASRYS
jgi:N-acetylglucosamine-6-phosphate deacetylase